VYSRVSGDKLKLYSRLAEEKTAATAASLRKECATSNKFQREII